MSLLLSVKSLIQQYEAKVAEKRRLIRAQEFLDYEKAKETLIIFCYQCVIDDLKEVVENEEKSWQARQVDFSTYSRESKED